MLSSGSGAHDSHQKQLRHPRCSKAFMPAGTPLFALLEMTAVGGE